MAIVRWTLLAIVAVIALGTWWKFVLAAAPADDHRPDRYYCPMHPQIRSAERGTCPICYMNLEPIPQGTARRAPSDGGVPDAGPQELALAPVMLTTERRQRAGIATVPARLATISSMERWPASIEASEGARGEVRVRTDAFIERIAIRQSNVSVRAGQTLAFVYSPELVRVQEELLVARRWSTSGDSQAPPELASAAAAARERLLSLGMSAGDIDAIVESGRSRRTVAVRAPISGTITRFEAAVGSYATPETLLYEITDYSRVRVVATPHASDLAWLAPTIAARFVPQQGGEEIPLTFELLEPRVTEGTRTARARFSAASTTALRPGDIGEVVVTRPPHEALLVPRDAVIDTGTQRYVFVERSEGLFEPRIVRTSELHEEQRMVTEGLRVGERVVARGAFVLDSESRLQAALAPADAGPRGAAP